MRITAHRGYAHDNPENTLQAVSNAISDDPTDSIEIDIRRCKTGELVVIHDNEVERVGDIPGTVQQSTFEKLKTISINGSSEPIPLFKELIKAIPETIELNVELKETGIAKDSLDILGSRSNYIIQSFDPEILSEVRESGYTGSMALLSWEYNDKILEIAEELHCTRINLCLDNCTKEIVQKIQSEGFDVDVWTIRSKQDYKVASSYGVDGVISDSKTYLK